MPSEIIKSLSNIPPPGSERIAIRVTPAAEGALRQHHPWLYEGAVTHQNRDGKPGDLAVIFDKNRKFLAIGLYDPTSPIRVRILADNPVLIDSKFFRNKLQSAVKIRSILPENTTAYRLIHGGSDGFPGLVVDRYGETLVIKLYTTAWLPYLSDIANELKNLHPYKRLVLRLSRKIQKSPPFLYQLQDGMILKGPPITEPILFQENGLWFECDPINGHKTGFYLDQRDNRNRVSHLAAGKSVLNVFAYTGGFSVYAAKGGATSVISTDISEPALDAAQRNFNHNLHDSSIRTCKHDTVTGDAFQILTQFHAAGLKFDMIIIDPPSFANQPSQVKGAISAYQRLTRLGLMLLNEGGNLVQSSCSSRVKEEEFFQAVYLTAANMGRKLQEIKQTTHPIDHPIGFKEAAYLKCIFTRV